jgi:hypothetical protein
MSHEEFIGPIPPGAQVQHKCDRKDCINPKHLKLGTPATNIADIFSRGDPDLTPQEFERLSAELADLDRKAEVSNIRREQIEAQLRRAIKDRRDEFKSIIKEHRLAMRLRRKAAREEHEQERQDRRTQTLAKINPEAMAKLKASIAELKERSPEELKADLVAEAAQRRANDPRRWRRNGSASASEEDSHVE